ncbi:MAG TPA: aspartate aminotransferase family protein [Solirubrobacterales bacterium]|nr:aspartate aminotransferase family protein [Solirubrobacterales bacterium]
MSAETFDLLRERTAPGTALAAKLAGGGAVEEAAEGARVRLSDGREAIDFGAYGVTLLGHRHPAVVAAVEDQLRRMPTATRLLANAETAAFAEELAARFDLGGTRVWLGSDGADAVEAALKLARRASGRMRVLAVEGGFHGKTLGALALTWNPAFREGLEPLLAAVTHIDPQDAGAVARETAAGDVAALVFEPRQGEGGARALGLEILRRWARDARAAGAFVISDEVQAGLRRCGPPSVALEAGVEIDALLFGKALGGGVMPLSAVVAGERLFEPLRTDPTFHTATFAGHPLACAAGRAALRANDELAASAAILGARLERELDRLAAAHPEVVVTVHGAGLMHALELATPAMAGSMLLDLAQAGLLVSPCLSAPSSLRLLPPMVTGDDELDTALELLDGTLAVARRFAPAAVEVAS